MFQVRDFGIQQQGVVRSPVQSLVWCRESPLLQCLGSHLWDILSDSEFGHTEEGQGKPEGNPAWGSWKGLPVDTAL